MKLPLLVTLFLGASSLFGVEVQENDNLVVYSSDSQTSSNQPRRTVVNNTPTPTSIIVPAPVIQNSSCSSQQFLAKGSCIRVSVLGQGVAPVNTASPAQAFALAKRAAIADSYRLIAEKIKGVNVDGHDYIKNMMVKRSTIRTAVNAMVQNANITETVFKDGLCEVEMEILVYHSQFD